MNVKNGTFNGASSVSLEERVSSTAFAILPEYFIDKLTEEEREYRIHAYKKAFEDAKRKLNAGRHEKPETKLKGWFDIFEFGGGI